MRLVWAYTTVYGTLQSLVGSSRKLQSSHCRASPSLGWEPIGFLPRTDERTVRFSCRWHCQMRLVQADAATYSTTRSEEAPRRKAEKSPSRAMKTWRVPFVRCTARTNGRSHSRGVCTGVCVSASPIRRYVVGCCTPEDRGASGIKARVAP
jgi:hypothetical protein